MRHSLRAVVLLLAVGCGGASAHGAAPQLHVLFLGNSLTAANDLPAVVGEAWRSAWRRNALLALYGPDGFHPSKLGTTLAALVITARLTNTPPAGIALPNRPKTARLLRAAAAEVLRSP